MLNTTRSQQLVTEAVAVMPGGVNSNVRLSQPAVFFERGEGAWMHDVDGNDYVDYMLGQGPNFLGHSPASVMDAVFDACGKGVIYSGRHPLEIDAAKKVIEALGWADMIRLGMSGTEADQAALRLARAATGRRKFIYFEGHYHGWLDNVLIDMIDGKPSVGSLGQYADYISDAIVIPWNDAAALEQALDQHKDEIAAVLMEPVMCNEGAVPPQPGYLKAARQLCDKHATILIFDEVITGFRIARGGAAERFGVEPDLAVYGKAVGSGWPVSVLAGKRHLMQHIADGSVTHAGTLNGNVMAAAAVAATMDALTESGLYARIETYGEKLKAMLAEVSAAHGMPLRLHGLGSVFHTAFGGHANEIRDGRDVNALDLGRYARFTHVMAAHGLWVPGRGIWFVSAAHDDKAFTATRERFDAACAQFMSAGTADLNVRIER
jgi:glutamate-1-semialdehyde 2,1-aminomutase